MKFKLFFFSFLLFGGLNLNAKTDVVIKGQVTDGKNGPALPFATVSVMNKSNKVLTGNSTDNNGIFEIKLSNDQISAIKISFIGYKDTLVTIPENTTSTINMGSLFINKDSKTLQAAVVTSKIPIIEQKIDKIVMNVSEAVFVQNKTGFEVLKRCPGVIIDQNGNIMLNGQPVQILIDNRPVNMGGNDLVALLEGTDGAMIDKIEIMANPSSKYDASGSGGIINIRTKKNFLKGVYGNLRANYNVAAYHRGYTGFGSSVNLNYKTDKNNLSLSYSQRASDDFWKLYTETYYGNNQLLSSQNTDMSSNGHNFKVVDEYSINKKNIIGVVVGGSFRTMSEDSFGASGSTFYLNNVKTESINTSIANMNLFNSMYANLNYTGIFSDGGEITLNADYSKYNIGNRSSQSHYYFDPTLAPSRDPLIYHNDSKQFIDIYSFKADYERMIGKKIKLETGFKVSRSQTDNDLIRQDRQLNNWVKNDSLSSVFMYNEDILAAYITAGSQISKKSSVKVGVRAEYTNVYGDWISSDTTTRKGYINIFPTFFYGYNASKDFKFNASYTLRIMRPRFNQLNPFKLYIDVNSSVEGNPELDPQFNHQFNLGMYYKNYISLNLSYQYSDGAIVENPYFNPTNGKKFIRWENFGQQHIGGLQASLNEYQIKKWMYISINGFAGFVKHQAGSFDNTRFFGYANSTLTFILPKDIRIENTVNLKSKFSYGYMTLSGYANYSLYARKSFLKNQASFYIGVEDIFRSGRQIVTADKSEIDRYYFRRDIKSTYLSIGLSYKFGKAKSSKQRRVAEQEEASRVN